MADRPPFARVAIIGVPGAGKTTLFSALSGMDYARVVAASGKVIGAGVRVQHPELLEIHRKEEPKSKLTCPTVEIFDTPPIALEGADRDRNPSVLHQLREMSGLIVVLRAYDLEGDATQKKKALEGQLDRIRTELLLSDAEALQRRVEKIDDRLKRTLPTAEREELQAERGAVAPLVESITSGTFTTMSAVAPSVEKALRSFALFARKPILTIVNLGERDLGTLEGIPLRLEPELLAMPEEERGSYMKDYGISALQLPLLPVRLQEALGFVTFLTVGDTETVGWPLRKGACGPEAAGVIHTDLQKGFVNIEVLAHADYLKHGTIKEAERQGRKRVEGKNYALQNFDIVHVRSTR